MRIIDKRFHAERNLKEEAKDLLDEIALQAAIHPLIMSIKSHYTRTPGEFIKHLPEEQRELLKYLKA